MPREPIAIQATAYHEAGHAVVLAHFGLPCSRVCVSEDDDSFGEAVHPSPIMVDCKPNELRTVARQMILAAYAGVAAQRLVDVDVGEEAGEQDEQNAFDLSVDYGVLPRRHGFIGDDRHRALLRRLRKEASQLVKRLQEPISMVAIALLENMSLTGEHVATIVQEYDRRIG